MATQKFFISGYGGQGVILLGQLMAHAGIKEGKEVTFMPAYGPEMRGGMAYCTVIISDKKIGCPVVSKADSVIIMDQASMDKFADRAKNGGKVFINSSLVHGNLNSADVELINVPATGRAIELENEKSANLVMLGEIVRKTGVVNLETVKEVLKEKFTGSKKRFLKGNYMALGI